MSPARTLTLLAVPLLFAACASMTPDAPPRSDDFQACRAVLSAQRDAWNAGDLAAFVDGYGGDAVFASVDGVRVGREDLLARYVERYPDRAAMGVLAFDELECSDLGDRHVLVRGVWRLARESGPVGGRFALVMRPVDGEWRVVLDYTTSDASVLGSDA